MGEDLEAKHIIGLSVQRRGLFCTRKLLLSDPFGVMRKHNGVLAATSSAEVSRLCKPWVVTKKTSPTRVHPPLVRDPNNAGALCVYHFLF